MPNKIFRDRLKNEITYAIREAQNAVQVCHPGLTGRIRELVAGHLLKPLLPAGYELGTGKIVDHGGGQSAETDLVIYNRAILPPVMYSERDGVFPVESSYYAIEVKSRITATEVQDAIRKGRTISALSYPGKPQGPRQHRGRTISVLFAFGSDLAESSSELERYAQYDEAWLLDPVIKAICVIGRGYWYYKAEPNAWVFGASTPEHDELVEFVSGIINTLLKNPPSAPVSLLGHYLMQERPVTIITKSDA
jgi:hypothetical protein